MSLTSKVFKVGLIGLVPLIIYDYLFCINPMLYVKENKNSEIAVKIANVDHSNSMGKFISIKNNTKLLEENGYSKISYDLNYSFHKFNGPTLKFIKPSERDLLTNFSNVCIENDIYTEVEYRDNFGIKKTKK